MMSVLFKIGDVNVGYLKVKMGLIKALLPKSMQEKESNSFGDRVDNSVPRVTDWHHKAEPHDAKQ